MPSTLTPTDKTTIPLLTEVDDIQYADTCYSFQTTYGLPQRENSSASSHCVIMPSVWVMVRNGDERFEPMPRPTKLSRNAIRAALTLATTFSQARAKTTTGRGGTTTTSDFANDLNDAIRTHLSSYGHRGALTWLPEGESDEQWPVGDSTFRSDHYESPPFANVLLRMRELSNTDSKVIEAHLKTIWGPDSRQTATLITNGSDADVNEDGITFRREPTLEGSDSQSQRVTYVPV